LDYIIIIDNLKEKIRDKIP